jgi:uncharacterized protein YaaW (UPF0174 family)
MSENAMFTIFDSVSEALSKGDDKRMKAELYLALHGTSYTSNNYRKTSRNVTRLNNKIRKLQKKKDDNVSEKINNLEIDLQTAIDKKEKLIDSAIKNDLESVNPELIAKKLVFRHKEGLMIGDAINGVWSKDSSYGRMVAVIFRMLSKRSLKEKINKIRGKGKQTQYEIIMKSENFKMKGFLQSREGAVLLESHFILYLMTQMVKDADEKELKEILDSIAADVAKSDEELAKKIGEIYKGGNVAGQFTKIFLQVLRLSVGKGAFMNASVRMTNVMLRSVVGKGMTFGQNAVFRKYLASLMGSGPAAIFVAAIMTIPDIAGLLNRRDYPAVIQSILFLFFLRNNEKYETKRTA